MLGSSKKIVDKMAYKFLDSENCIKIYNEAVKALDNKQPTKEQAECLRTLELNMHGFKYDSKEIKNSDDPQKHEGEIKVLIKGKNKVDVCNMLYSATINGNNTLVENIITHGSGGFIKNFDKQKCTEIYNAVAKVIEKSPNSKDKIMTEKYLETLKDKMKLDEKSLYKQKNEINRN